MKAKERRQQDRLQTPGHDDIERDQREYEILKQEEIREEIRRRRVRLEREFSE